MTHDLDSLASVTNEELNLKRGKLILRLNNLDLKFLSFGESSIDRPVIEGPWSFSLHVEARIMI